MDHAAMGHGDHAAASPKNTTSPAAMGMGMGKSNCKISVRAGLDDRRRDGEGLTEHRCSST